MTKILFGRGSSTIILLIGSVFQKCGLQSDNLHIQVIPAIRFLTKTEEEKLNLIFG